MSLRRGMVAGAALVALVGLPTAANAQQVDYVGTTPPTVESKELTRTPVQVLGVQETREDTLPVTGGDLAGLALLGASAMGVGMVLVRRGRTTSATA